MKFQEFIEIMSASGFEKPADIARELGVSPQTVNNWKSRDKIPKKISSRIEKFYKRSSKKKTDPNPVDEKRNSISDTSNIPKNPTPIYQQYFYEDDTVSLWGVISIIKKYIAIILGFPTVFCAFAIFYVLYIAKPVYTSTATIIPANSAMPI